MNHSESFGKIVEHRRSVRVYDCDIQVDENILRKCLQRATLAPNSSNLQLWEFYWVRNKEKKNKLVQYCLNQSAANTAQELVVIVVRKDLWKKRALFNLNEMKKAFAGKEDSNRAKMVFNYYGKLIPSLYFTDFLGIFGLMKWIMVNIYGIFKPMYRQVTGTDTRIVAHKSAALAAQTFMLALSAENLDSCPMEGFDSERVKKLLELPYGAEISMVISVGVRKPEGVYGERIRVKPSEVIFEV
jgi:nitroreductase